MFENKLTFINDSLVNVFKIADRIGPNLMSFNAKRNIFATGSENLSTWSFPEFRQLQTFPERVQQIESIALSDNQVFLAVGTANRKLGSYNTRILNLTTLQQESIHEYNNTGTIILHLVHRETVFRVVFPM
jgi:hypothetical protein